MVSLRIQIHERNVRSIDTRTKRKMEYVPYGKRPKVIQLKLGMSNFSRRVNIPLCVWKVGKCLALLECGGGKATVMWNLKFGGSEVPPPVIQPHPLSYHYMVYKWCSTLRRRA